MWNVEFATEIEPYNVEKYRLINNLESISYFFNYVY